MVSGPGKMPCSRCGEWASDFYWKNVGRLNAGGNLSAAIFGGSDGERGRMGSDGDGEGVGCGPTHGLGVDRCDEASVMELISLSQHSKAGFEAANEIIHKMLKKMWYDMLINEFDCDRTSVMEVMSLSQHSEAGFQDGW